MVQTACNCPLCNMSGRTDPRNSPGRLPQTRIDSCRRRGRSGLPAWKDPFKYRRTIPIRQVAVALFLSPSPQLFSAILFAFEAQTCIFESRFGCVLVPACRRSCARTGAQRNAREFVDGPQRSLALVTGELEVQMKPLVTSPREFFHFLNNSALLECAH